MKKEAGDKTMSSRKTRILTAVVLAALMLAACGSGRTDAPGTETPAPSPSAGVTAKPEAKSSPEPERNLTIKAETAPIPKTAEDASPAAEPAPSGDPEASPSPEPAPTLPRVTKSPTDETVDEGGSCLFLANYENAEMAVWHFVSPDGQTDMTYEAAQTAFPTMEILNGMYSNLQLRNIPYAANGWKVYCRYSNTGAGYVDTGMAVITVIPKPNQAAAAVPAAQNVSFNGNWADEETGLCQILFTYRDDSSRYVGILRRDTSGRRDCWNMTATAYSENVLIYEDGYHWAETYSNDNSYEVSDETWNGSGSFYIENGRLHWYNAQTGEEVVLIPS